LGRDILKSPVIIRYYHLKILMKKATFIIGALSLAVPALAFAQNFGYVDNVVGAGRYYLGVAVTVLMILMTLWFLWTVFKFIGEKDATKRKDRQKQMVAGLVGLFIAVGVWGIIRIATRVTGVDPNASFGTTCPPGYYYDSRTQSCMTR
jgi:hypothetical protein